MRIFKTVPHQNHCLLIIPSILWLIYELQIRNTKNIKIEPCPEYVVRHPQKPVVSAVLRGDFSSDENRPMKKQPTRFEKNDL